MDERRGDIHYRGGAHYEVEKFALDNGYVVSTRQRRVISIEPIGWLVPVASEYLTHIGVICRAFGRFTIVDPLWIWIEREKILDKDRPREKQKFPKKEEETHEYDLFDTPIQEEWNLAV